MTAGLFKMRSVVILGSDLLPSETTRNLTCSNTEMSTVKANRLLLTTPVFFDQSEHGEVVIQRGLLQANLYT